MKKSRFTEEQIAFALRPAKAVAANVFRAPKPDPLDRVVRRPLGVSSLDGTRSETNRDCTDERLGDHRENSTNHQRRVL